MSARFPERPEPRVGLRLFFCAGFLQAVFFRRRSDGARERFSRAPAEISVRARRELGESLSSAEGAERVIEIPPGTSPQTC